MATYFVRFVGTVGFLVLTLSIILSPGCSQEQAPPPVQAPPAAGAPQPGVAAAPGTPQSGAAPAAQPAAGGAAAQNVSQIQVGMTQEQIQQLMGAPGQTKQKGQISEWKYYTPQGKVEIKFQNNQVVAIEKH